MAGPYGTGGGGFRFEDRVASYYLASILTETPARGLLGEYPISIGSQRADLGEPLDDLMIEGRGIAGETTRLKLQLKSQISFTRSNAEWADCVRRSWDTAFTQGFDPATDRVGVAVATLSARADAHYRTVLTWARNSQSGADFMRRITLKDFSHQLRGAFVDDVRHIIRAHIATDPTDEDLWRLLRSFVILHFDFNADASSGDENAAIATIQAYLTGADKGRSRDIWNALDTLAGHVIPTAGSVARDQLVERLSQEQLPTGAAPSLRLDLAAIDAESHRALKEIRTTIGPLHLHRTAALLEFAGDASGKQFIQFVSEPGAGKSAVLREIAERYAADGPIFVLKNDRIHPRGWPAMASNLQLRGDLDAIINAFAAAGTPVLFIDGIDRVTDPAAQVTINDILRAVIGSPTNASWLVIVTVREQNLRHLDTWLEPEVLSRLGVRTITIEPLTDDEKEVVADSIPRLRPLFRDGDNLDVLLSRPFFLEAILKLSSAAGNLPASEAELLDLWWQLGAANDPQFATAQKRRDVLIDLAGHAAALPNTPLPIGGLDANAVDELRSADVLRDHLLGHSVNFTHDIYEEWAFAELILRNQADLPAFLKQCGEPQTLARATQLIGARELERDPTGSAWLTLLGTLQTDEMRPVWQRSVLTAPLHSTRTGELLTALAPQLLQLDNRIFERLLKALRTLEVVPNSQILDLDVEIDYETRVKLAELSALPKIGVWVRFFEWLIPQLPSLPMELVPALVPVLATWQNALGGMRVRFCREIGVAACRWLREAEDAFHPARFEDRRDPFGAHLSYENEKKLETGLRQLALSSAGDAPDAVSRYLDDQLADRLRLHHVREEIVSNSAKVAVHLPAKLVDFTLSAFIANPAGKRGRAMDDDDGLGRGFGLADNMAFYPSSPLKPPFLVLLRNHPEEGLRLVQGLTNHATGHWRTSYARRGWTAIPMDLEFGWGSQRFWGDATVFEWFRALNGPHAVESALMAVEQWSFEELDRGADFGAHVERILKGSESVALIGIAVSLALYAERRSIPTALPLVMSQRLWSWDIQRRVHDMASHPNEIGNWHSNRVYLEAVRKLNRKPHRQGDIRALINFFLLSDDEARTAYRAKWTGFETDIPFDIEEQKNNPETVAELTEKARIFAQQADLSNWCAVPSADGTHFELQVAAPYAEEPKHQEALVAKVRLNAAMRLALWAEKSREKDAVDPQLTLETALAAAREADDESLFEAEADGEEAAFGEATFLAAGVAGTAYVAARHLADEAWNDEIGSWCLSVFERVATTPEPKNLGGRSSMPSMSPQVFAVYGYSALVKRGFATHRSKSALLSLAVDAMEAVETAVYDASLLYADREPRFVDALLSLGVRRCIYVSGMHPEHYSLAWSKQEAEREMRFLDETEASLQSGEVLPLPGIPGRWIELPTGDGEERYALNDHQFNYRLAEQTVLHLPLHALLSTEQQRGRIIGLATQLIAYTGEQIVPPFAERKRDNRGNTPYEWVHRFSSWCGRLAAALGGDSAVATMIDQIIALPEEAAFSILDNFMRLYMIDAILKPEIVPSFNIATWQRLTSWIFDHREAQGALPGRHMDREYQGCAFTTMFCATVDIGRLVCGADRGWQNIKLFEGIVAEAVDRFGSHGTLFLGVAKLLQAAGLAFFPEPALAWLRKISVANRSNQEFWDANGDLMVDVLKAALAENADLTQNHGQTVMFIADILVDNGVRGAGFLQQEISKRGS